VGKSLTHWLAARALYNVDALADSRCPGHACAGYKAGTLLCCEGFVLPRCTACRGSRQAWLLRGPAPQYRSHASPASDAMPPMLQVLYGMDYVSAERAEQHAYLRAALLDHLKQVWCVPSRPSALHLQWSSIPCWLGFCWFSRVM
jgi:hypothetical protein